MIEEGETVLISSEERSMARITEGKSRSETEKNKGRRGEQKFKHDASFLDGTVHTDPRIA